MQLFVLHETKSVIDYSVPIFGLISCLFSILHISLPCLLFGVKPLFWPSFSPIIISVRLLILLCSCIRSSSFSLSFFATLPLLPSEVQSCQRAYFYQRFPFLHVDSGDHFLMYSLSFFFVCDFLPFIPSSFPPSFLYLALSFHDFYVVFFWPVLIPPAVLSVQSVLLSGAFTELSPLSPSLCNSVVWASWCWSMVLQKWVYTAWVWCYGHKRLWNCTLFAPHWHPFMYIKNENTFTEIISQKVTYTVHTQSPTYSTCHRHSRPSLTASTWFWFDVCEVCLCDPTVFHWHHVTFDSVHLCSPCDCTHCMCVFVFLSQL